MSKSKSFSTARKSFVTNLNKTMTKLNLFPTTLAFKLNATSQSGNVTNPQTINDWLEGKKIPSLYAYYKLCQYLNISMDDLMDTQFETSKATGKSYAAQCSTTPKVCDITGCCACHFDNVNVADISVEDLLTENLTNTLTSMENQMTTTAATHNTVPTTCTTTNATTTTKNAVTKRDRTTPAERVALVASRTSSDKFNPKLAYAILNSGMTMEELSELTGISIRSLRNYAYYGVSISPERAYILLKTLKSCNYATLGLRLSTDTKRYVAV